MKATENIQTRGVNLVPRAISSLGQYVLLAGLSVVSFSKVIGSHPKTNTMHMLKNFRLKGVRVFVAG